MGRIAEAREESDDVFEFVDNVLGRHRRPGEEPPKSLYIGVFAGIVVLLLLILYLVVSSLFLGGGSSDGETLEDAPEAPVIPAGAEACSARDFGGAELTDQEELPVEVRTTRLEVGRLAAACDLDGLRALMADDFIWGGVDQSGPDPARADWEAKEAAGQPVLLRLAQVATLDADVAADGTYVFPAASQWAAPQWANPRPEVEAALTAVYGPENMARWKESGQFDGYRIGIRPDGSWFYFTGGVL